MERSIAGQVEFWARLGRSIESLLGGDQVLALCRNAATRPLSECMASAMPDAVFVAVPLRLRFSCCLRSQKLQDLVIDFGRAFALNAMVPALRNVMRKAGNHRTRAIRAAGENQREPRNRG